MTHVVPPVDRDATSALRVLAEAAGALHGQPDLPALLSWAAAAGRRTTGAETCGVCLVTHGSSPEWSTSLEPGAPDFSRLGDPRAVDVLLPVLRGDATLVASAVAGDARLAGRLAAAGPLGSVLVIALRDADAVRGALFVGHRDPSAFDAEAEAAAAALAAHLGVALGNHATLSHLEELRAVRDKVVHELQKAVRPPAPVIAHTEVGVHYQAAEEHAPTGGDLYDWIVLPGGDLHLAVVDIMGKGVEATKDAVAVTHALRALAVDWPLEELVARTDAIVTAQNPNLVATLVVARYEPDTGRIRFVGGGHPPPIIVTAAGSEELTLEGIPIGWPGAGSFSVVERILGRDDSVVLYTDGLIEATKDIVKGLADLRAAAEATAGYPPPHMARALVDRALAGAARHDDSLALVLRRRTPPEAGTAHPLAGFSHRLARSLAAVPVARGLLRDWLDRVPVEARESEDLLLVATELCTNALRHSRESGDVVLRASTEGDAVVLEVEDPGPGFDLPVFDDDWLAPLVGDDDVSGRGLRLVASLTDELTNTPHGAGHLVRAVRRAVAPTGGDAPG